MILAGLGGGKTVGLGEPGKQIVRIVQRGEDGESTVLQDGSGQGVFSPELPWD